MLPKIDTYINLLQTHDWSYDYSDDHSKWQRGFAERETLKEYAREVDPTYQIWNEYAPEGFKQKIFLLD